MERIFTNGLKNLKSGLMDYRLLIRKEITKGNYRRAEELIDNAVDILILGEPARIYKGLELSPLFNFLNDELKLIRSLR